MRPGLRVLHQAQAGTRTDAAGLGKFAAHAVGIRVSHPPSAVGWLPGEIHLFDLEWLKFQPIDVWRGGVRFVMQGHGDVDVLEDAARGDAEYAVGGFHEVVTFASAVLAAEMVDEAETGAELFGFYEETGAIRLPLL